MLSKQVVRMVMVVTVLSIGFFGSGFGRVAFADHLDVVDAYVEKADALIEYSDALIEATDQTVESADSAIETVDLIVEDAIANFEDNTFCKELMAHADVVIEALVSKGVIPVDGEVLGILGGADLLVEAVDGVVEDAEDKLVAAENAFPTGGTGVEARALRALKDALAAVVIADGLVEDADMAVEAAIAVLMAADADIEAAENCNSLVSLKAADTAVEDADDAVEDADVAVEDADAAIEFADREIEHADKLIEAANKK